MSDDVLAIIVSAAFLVVLAGGSVFIWRKTALARRRPKQFYDHYWASTMLRRQTGERNVPRPAEDQPRQTESAEERPPG